ncbi:MAG: ferredoxin family protein [Nitrososphaeria archaeon]
MSTPERKLRLTDIINVNIWDVDSKPHITVNYDKCKNCPTKACVRLCPTGCYTETENGILFSYEGCVECGTCRVVCPMEAITWTFPKSGKGIFYRFS